MSKFKIFETNQFMKDLEGDFSGQQTRIIKKLHYHVYPQIKANPYFGKNIKKLVNYKPETWRYRIGNYRFFYEIDDKEKIIYMIAADSRQNAY
ncbi:MAG: type II toxin-antitoxin system RelE family toxin [Atribacterota bacterium]